MPTEFSPEESRRMFALELAVKALKRPDYTSESFVRYARSFETYLKEGK